MRAVKRCIPVVLVLTAALVSPSFAMAQMPAIPGAPALPGGPVPAVPALSGSTAAAAPAAGGTGSGGNLWSFFMKTPAQKAQIQQCICGSPIGQFLNNMMMPMSMATGGLIGGICPAPNVPNPADLAKPANSAQGAAAKIKADEAQAKAKIAALEYLATVDCRYYPEAGAAMIAGLRAEKNECVRLAAAKALAAGCCCNAKVIKALTICVECSNRDGFPAEASELVRAFAYVALERCLMKCVEAEPETPPEPPAGAKKALYETLAPIGTQPDYTLAILLVAYYSPDSTETEAALIASARRALSKGLQVSPRTAARLSGPRNARDMIFPPQGGLAMEAAQPLAPPRVMQTRQMAVVVEREAAEPVPVKPASMPTATENRAGRGNLLNIIQDALKK